MATDAQIQAGLTSSSALTVSFTQLLAWTKRAFLAATLTDNGQANPGPYVVTTFSDGTQLAYSTLDQLIAAMEYFRRMSIVEQCGGMVVAFPEGGGVAT